MSTPSTTVADGVGATLAAQGIRDVFGVIGSGNLVVANALAAHGARFHAARHEGGAISMADGYARASGLVGVCTVHQGPGLTNATTGLTEAAKSHTPLLVLAAEAPAAALTSNFRIDQAGLATAVGAATERIHSPATAAADAIRALHRADHERTPVVLNLPIDIQAQPAPADPPNAPAPAAPTKPRPTDETIAHIADLLQRADRPAIIAGRGAVIADAGAALRHLADVTGAVLATSAAANGLFHGHPHAIGIAGGFTSPQGAELLQEADVILAVGASLNYWTTRHGALVGHATTLVQIDDERTRLGRHHPVDLAVHGDAGLTTTLLATELARREPTTTRQPPSARPWAQEPYEDAGTDTNIDPRTFSIELERRLGPHKTVTVDSGAFMGYPSMYLSVPDARAWVFVNGYQSIGLGLAAAIGAALARPGHPTVAAVGDGGLFMALAELETAVRLRLKLLVAVYDDRAYGAEVHHFAPMGHAVSHVQFPDADLAAIARACGAHATTVRRSDDLTTVTEWLHEQTPRPLVLDAKVNPAICADWLTEAFKAG